jgi:hypothetical protein
MSVLYRHADLTDDTPKSRKGDGPRGLTAARRSRTVLPAHSSRPAIDQPADCPPWPAIETPTGRGSIGPPGHDAPAPSRAGGGRGSRGAGNADASLAWVAATRSGYSGSSPCRSMLTASVACRPAGSGTRASTPDPDARAAPRRRRSRAHRAPGAGPPSALPAPCGLQGPGRMEARDGRWRTAGARPGAGHGAAPSSSVLRNPSPCCPGLPVSPGGS